MSSIWLQVWAATAAAWIGACVAALLRQSASRAMRPLVYVALVCFGAAAIFDILPESKAALRWPVFLVAAASGYVVFWAVSRFVAPICPACAVRTLEHDHHHSHGEGLVVLAIVLGAHCFLDGLAVSAASSVEAAFGFRVFATIAIHKLPEGFALTLLLMTGRSIPSAVLSAIAIEASTLLGALAGGDWTHPSEFWLSVVLANIGGTFLYLCVSGLRDALTPRSPVIGARSAV